MKLAIAGMGNNASALLQGIRHYQTLPRSLSYDGLRHADLCGIHVTEIECLVGFDTDPAKQGLTIGQAVLADPNNFPVLQGELKVPGPVVAGMVDPTASEIDRVCRMLRRSDVEVLLISLPTGLEAVAIGYARAAAYAGVGVVNCSADKVARNQLLMEVFIAKGLPLIGDDLASHFGSSLLHKRILELLSERGLHLDGSYQLNIGGNEDFRNLQQNGEGKRESKLNVLGRLPELTVVPSAGYVPFLKDHKVAHIRVDAHGWAGSEIAVDVRLEVQDSSNAAGVIVDLVRLAANGRTRRLGGMLDDAKQLLKSPGAQQPIE